MKRNISTLITQLINKYLPEKEISIFQIEEREIKEIKGDGINAIEINGIYFKMKVDEHKCEEKIEEQWRKKVNGNEEEDDVSSTVETEIFDNDSDYENEINPEDTLIESIALLIEEKMINIKINDIVIIIEIESIENEKKSIELHIEIESIVLNRNEEDQLQLLF